MDSREFASRAVAVVRARATSTPDELRAIRATINALAARESELLLQLAELGIAEEEGTASVSVWARGELNQDAGKTRAQVRAGRVLRELPLVAEAAYSGSVSARHLDSFDYALRFLGFEATRLIEEPLLELAVNLPPEDFHRRIREIRATYHPDDLDRAWLRGMDKEDIRCVRVGDGWHVTGFLPIEIGAKFAAVLDNLSVPRQEGDVRSPAARRVDGLDSLLSSVLQSGLPADNGIRPHVHVVVRGDQPVDLEKFGPIGPALAGLIGCSSDMTPYLVDPAGDVTGVGRSKRLATPSQTKAVRLRQGGVCNRKGCRHAIAHVNHITWWSDGGVTELSNLEGLCRKCHTLTHLRKPIARARTG